MHYTWKNIQTAAVGVVRVTPPPTLQLSLIRVCAAQINNHTHPAGKSSHVIFRQAPHRLH